MDGGANLPQLVRPNRRETEERRVLLYIPGYTFDRDAQSLRITQLANVLGPRGWRFDLVTTPTFLFRHQTLRVKLQHLHDTHPHLRAFVTHPALMATLRNRLLYKPVDPDAAVSPRRRAPEPRASRRFLRQLYDGYYYMFAQIGDPDWIVPGVLQGLRLQSSGAYQLVFASASWYFASHIAAAIVSGMRGLPLILDYGDPWSPEPPHHPRWLDRVAEAAVVRRARKIIVTNERARDLLLEHHPFLRADRMVVIPQGYREQPHGDRPQALDDGTFTIVYTGSLWSGLRSSIEFLKGVRAARGEGIDVKFLRAGATMPREEVEQIEALGLASAIKDLGHLPHEDALTVQSRATVLLVIGNRSRAQIPGKVIEYIGAKRPILCLSEGPGDLAANFVRDHGLGVVVPNRAEEILEALRELHKLWQGGRLEGIYRRTNVEAFSWHHLARNLEDVFREALEDGSRA